MLDSVSNGLREIGNAFTPASIAATRELLAVHALRPADVGARIERDLVYGDDARHRLDIFHAPGDASLRPIVVFVHGGGFAMGDKGDANSPFFNNVGAWAVREGFVGATMNYRYAPANVWPSGARDVAAAVSWLLTHASRFHGDASRIMLVGHSAGGAHVAGYLAGQGSVDGPGQEVAAAVLISGVFEPDLFERNPMHETYFGTNRERYAARSAVLGLAKTTVPCLFTISEFDPPQFHRQLAAVYAARVATSGQCPEVAFLSGHNHVSPVMSLGLDCDEVGNQLAGYVSRIQART